MRFLLDAGVPRSVQDFLIREGFDALRLVQTKLFAATDKEVFSFAVFLSTMVKRGMEGK